MRCFTPVPVVALVSTLMLGCADQQSPTALADPTAHSLSASVERGTIPFPPSVFLDFVGGHTVEFGATFEDLVSFCPGFIPTTQEVDQLTVTRPDDSFLSFTRGKDLDVVVWDGLANPCDLLEAPHFTGTARFVSKDTDVDLSGHGADATGFSLIGTVTDESGQSYHLVVLFLGTVAPGSTLDNFVLVGHVSKVQLTPIGR